MEEDEIETLKKKIAELEKRIVGLEGLPEQITQTNTKKTISSLLIDLKNEGFFDQPKLVKEIIDALANKGYHYEQTSLTWTFQNLVRKGILGRIKRDKKWAYVKR